LYFISTKVYIAGKKRALMHEELLLKTGLSLREINVYLTLLQNGELMASEIAKKTGMIRTNAYDVLASLIKKGIVAYAIKNGKKFFHAAEPEKLVDYINTQEKDLEETKEQIAAILPQLRPIETDVKKPVIEIYEGKEGMKTLLAMSIRESLKTGKEIIGISVQQQKCRDLAGPYHVRWYDERGRRKIKSRYLMSAEEPIIPVKYTQFKVLPEEAKNPNEIFIFGDVTSHFIFVGDVFSAVIIKSKEVTDRYRAYFDFLWKLIK